MNILVINAGSSSLKYQLIDITSEKCLCSGGIDCIGLPESTFTEKVDNIKVFEKKFKFDNHTEALKEVFKVLTDSEIGVIKDISEINAVGHRVLHSGEDFDRSVIITDDVMAILEKNRVLGPLHMPANIACIKSCLELLPDVPMVSVFDTAFHMTMPKYAYMYGIKYEDYEQYKVRRYGFHGTSHKYVTGKAIEKMGTVNCKIINCHLGNGSSISAVKDGKCMDTSMGFTPLEGLIMGTRSGDIDPACLEFLMDAKGLNIKQMLTYLNKESGFLGVSGVSSDARKLEAAANDGNERAKLALDIFAYRIKKYIGSYAAALGGVDCIVFTGGIGENSSTTRERVMRGMEWLGVDFDYELNKSCPMGSEIELSKSDSKVRVFVIPTNEELVIARETYDLIK